MTHAIEPADRATIIENGSVVADALRGLLSDDGPETIDASECGRWAGDVEALIDVRRLNGVAGVRKAFDVLAGQNPGLGKLVAAEPAPARTSWTVGDLLDAEFPEPRWAAQGLIPVGLSILAGRPKIGKSWLGLQLARAVAMNNQFLGVDVGGGDVLYLALEDSARRIQSRLRQQGITREAGVTFEVEWPHLKEGGFQALEERLTESDAALVVIDTLSRATGRVDQMDLAEVTTVLEPLQRLALDRNSAILLIDHHRKKGNGSDDPVDDILGTTAKAAVVDAVLGLYRESGKRTSSLRVTGRDMEERELALGWDVSLCCWYPLNETDGVREDTVKGDVLQAVEEIRARGDLATTTSIADHLGKDKGNISHVLGDLEGERKIVKAQKQGREQPYEIPEQV